MDVILAPCEEFAFALVGWIGSRTYLRFMRAHAKDLGMFLNSHRWGVVGRRLPACAAWAASVCH